jgi:hypothetical protein
MSGALGQDEHAVVGAVGQREAAVAHAEAVEDHLGVDDVVVVTGAERRRVAPRADEVPAAVAVVIEHVGDEVAALEQERAAREVAEKRGRLRPPGDVAVEVGAGAVNPAGDAGGGAVVRPGVPDEVVAALAEDAVGALLQILRTLGPVARGGERLQVHAPLAVDVRGGGGLLDHVDGVAGGAEGPELALHVVERAVGLERLDRRRVNRRTGAAGLGLDLQPVGAGDLGRGAVVGVDDDLAEGLLVIEEEALGGLRVADLRAEDRRQVAREFVAAAALNSPAKTGDHTLPTTS